MMANNDSQEWGDVLKFWFPEGRSLNIDAQTHRAHWLWRMQGGANDQIKTQYSHLTEKAA